MLAGGVKGGSARTRVPTVGVVITPEMSIRRKKKIRI
jgi:hypothetical protein